MENPCVLAAVGETAGVFGMVAVCYLAIVGIVWKLVDHVNAGESHPKKADIVFKNVCDERHAGQRGTWLAELQATNQRIDDLKDSVDCGFADLKALLKSPGHGK